MKHRQHIWFSLNLAQEAIASKERLEALAFCVSVKAMFVSSTLKTSDITKVMDKFHIDHIKAKRILSNAKKFGYIRINKHTITILKLKEKFAFNIKLSVEDKSIYYNLNNVKKFIQQSILLNHIKKQNKVEDSQLIACSYKDKKYPTKKDTVLYNEAMKNLKHYAIDQNKQFYGLSYNRIASLLNITKNKAIELVSMLVSGGAMSKKVCKKELVCSKIDSSDIAFEFFKAKFNNAFVFVTKNGAIYKQESNCYRLDQCSPYSIVWGWDL